VLRHAGRGREEPWLFRAEGWDWRWHSWGEIADRMLRWAEALAAIPAGSRAAFTYVPRPAEVVLDLAIQAAGLISAPVSEELAGREADFRIEIDGEGLRITESSAPGRRERRDGQGGVVVVRQREESELTEVELIAMAQRLQAEIGASPGREIIVLGGPLAAPAERTMLAWATVEGAAVVLEPNPTLRVATAAWVRPTVFHGTREELAGLRKWVEKEKRPFWRRSPRLPFRRLRTVLVADGEALAEEDEAFWRERGVRTVGFRFP
jgi:hypothetical protein